LTEQTPADFIVCWQAELLTVKTNQNNNKNKNFYRTEKRFSNNLFLSSVGWRQSLKKSSFYLKFLIPSSLFFSLSHTHTIHTSCSSLWPLLFQTMNMIQKNC